jgi:hypothetical protein
MSLVSQAYEGHGSLVVGIPYSYLHLHPALVCLQERLGDGRAGEGVRLDEDADLGGIQFLDDRLGAAALGTEVDLDGRGRGYILLGLAGGEEADEHQQDG